MAIPGCITTINKVLDIVTQRAHRGSTLQDDASGRQQWVFSPVAGGGYYIRVLVGRNGGCGTYMSAPATCTVGQSLTFAAAPDTSGNQVWAVTQIA